MANRFVRASALFGLIAAGWQIGQPRLEAGDETNRIAEASLPPAAEVSLDPQQVQRSYLELQAQLQAALLAIQQMRQETDVSAKNHAEGLGTRLRLIEQAISLQHERDVQAMQQSNRFVLILGGVFAGVGLAAILFTGWLQLRAMNRLAEVAQAFPMGHVLPPGQPFAALAAGEHPAALNLVEQSNARLLGAIERLERRVHELEHSTVAAHSPHPPGQDNGERPNSGPPVSAAANASLAPDETAKRVTLLVGKGQALLNLGQPQPALGCFEEALSLDSANAETLVKKGSALEKLKRLAEAIDCYDRAIALNDSLTLAYLYKGGVYNQLERFDEALRCYEQALRTQQKAAAA